MTGFECFIDESGNTGPNLTEANQPIFVHAGLLVPTGFQAPLRSLAAQMHREYMPEAPELHTGILNTGRGRQRVAGLLRELNQLGAIPLVSLMERRCVYAAYVVDVCFDHAWNDRADIVFVASAEARQDLTQLLLDAIPDDHLREFADAFRARDPEAIRQSITTMSDDLRRGNHADVADVLLGSGPEMAEQCDSLRGTDEIATAMNTINVSSLVVVLSMCERVAEELALSLGRAIHDTSPQFPAYLELFKLFQRRRDAGLKFDNGQISVPLRRTAALTEEDSSSEPLLQLADIVAGTYRRLTAKRDRIVDHSFDDWLLYTVFFANERSGSIVSAQLVREVWTGPLSRAGAVQERA